MCTGGYVDMWICEYVCMSVLLLLSLFVCPRDRVRRTSHRNGKEYRAYLMAIKASRGWKLKVTSDKTYSTLDPRLSRWLG